MGKREELLRVLGDAFYHNKDVPETIDAILDCLAEPSPEMVEAAQKLSTQRVRMHEGHEWMTIGCDDEQVWEMIKAAIKAARDG